EPPPAPTESPPLDDGETLHPYERCANPGDEDGDGVEGCYDPDCAGHDLCLVETACDDGFDEDWDSLLDCADPDCTSDPACTEIDCADGLDSDRDGLLD